MIQNLKLVESLAGKYINISIKTQGLLAPGIARQLVAKDEVIWLMGRGGKLVCWGEIPAG